MASFGDTLRAILRGEKSEVEITTFLTTYNNDDLTAEHVRIGVEVMRENMTPVDIDDAIDIVGTGGTGLHTLSISCLLYTSPSPRDLSTSRMPSSA